MAEGLTTNSEQMESGQEAAEAARPVWLPEGTPPWVYRKHHPAIQVVILGRWPLERKGRHSNGGAPAERARA